MNAEMRRSATTEYATIGMITANTQTTLINDMIKKFQSIPSNLNRHSRVAQPGPCHSRERRNFFRHLVEQSFNAHETVLAGYVENEFVQDFPFRPRDPGRLDRLHEFL